MRVNISIDGELLKDFDLFCVKYRFNRSEFLTALMRATVYDDFTLKGARNLIRGVTGKVEEVKPQEAAQSVNETPKNLSVAEIKEIKREQIYENRNQEPIYAQIKQGYCEGHFEKGRTFKLYYVVYENENAIEAKRGWFCENCKNQLLKQADSLGTIVST